MNKGACFICLLLAFGICNAQNFTNASFEAWGSATTCSVNVPPDNWLSYTTAGLDPDEANQTLCPTTIPPAPSNGSIYARCVTSSTGGEGMYQNVTGFVAGNSYQISFDYAGSNLYGGLDNIQWHLYIDDINVYQTPVFSSTDAFWTTASYTFIAAAATHKIGIRLFLSSAGTGSGGIDNFNLTDLNGNCTIDASITASSTSITANLSGASYQWLDCANAFAPITGETGQTFTPATSGSYAVQVTDNVCTDTSDCTVITISSCPPISLTFLTAVAGPTLGNGAIRVFASGGDPPYLHSLDSLAFQTDNTFTSLSAGIYQVYVTDSNGCTAQGTFNIDQNCNCSNR